VTPCLLLTASSLLSSSSRPLARLLICIPAQCSHWSPAEVTR
jgi:hypothetical protein